MTRRLFRCAYSLLLLLLPLWAAAATVGQITHVSGAVLLRKADGSSRLVAPKSPVEEGDVVVTSRDSYARVKFTDSGEITLRPESQLRIDDYEFDRNSPLRDSLVMSLLKGGMRTITGLVGKRRTDTYRLQTITATIGIRGTIYGAQLCQGDCQELRTADGQVPADGLHLDVSEGTISVTNSSGTTLLAQNEFGYVPDVRTPLLKVPQGNGIPPPPPVLDKPAGLGGVNQACVVQ